MNSNILYRINRNIVNIPGWRTNRKIVVFESDDWGSIRVRSNEDTKALENEGFSFEGRSFYQYDGLESNKDLELLFEVLQKYRDKKGKNPIFTFVGNVANPDFEKIEKSGFEQYYWEPFTETLKRYPEHDKVFDLHLEGIKQKLSFPVFHGREHLNVQKWLRLLKEGNKSALLAFKHGLCSPMYGLKEEYLGELPAAFDLEFESDLEYQKTVIKEGLTLFELLWGFKSKYFVAPNGPFNNSLELDLYENGVEYILGEKRQREPLGNGRYKTNYRYLGMKNTFNQTYLARNAHFEPGILEGNLYENSVETGLRTINRAFRWNKPAIISSHRINYLGYLNPQNRDNGLRKLDEFLKLILKTWPDVEFMTSVELGDIITKKSI